MCTGLHRLSDRLSDRLSEEEWLMMERGWWKIGVFAARGAWTIDVADSWLRGWLRRRLYAVRRQTTPPDACHAHRPRRLTPLAIASSLQLQPAETQTQTRTSDALVPLSPGGPAEVSPAACAEESYRPALRCACTGGVTGATHELLATTWRASYWFMLHQTSVIFSLLVK